MLCWWNKSFSILISIVVILCLKLGKPFVHLIIYNVTCLPFNISIHIFVFLKRFCLLNMILHVEWIERVEKERERERERERLSEREKSISNWETHVMEQFSISIIKQRVSPPPPLLLKSVSPCFHIEIFCLSQRQLLAWISRG